MTGKRSPLHRRRLHLPGQSLDEEILRLRSEEITTYIAYGFIFFALAVAEWYRWITSLPTYPKAMTGVAVVVIAYSVYQIIRIRKRIRNLELGRDGEREVAEILDELRKKGYAVLHDIVAEDFNVDHVVVSPHGIYAVETKTREKPPGGEISFSGEDIIAGKFNLGSGPIRQVIAGAKWLHDLLAESTGRKFPVKPVLVFPGWFVQQTMSRELQGRVWVLNPKMLPSFIANEPKVLAEPDMHLAAFHLASYVRMPKAKSAFKYKRK